MLVRELIERVTSVYNQGVKNYYDRLSNRRIYSIISGVRSQLLTQMANKKQTITRWNYQTLDCVELETIDRSSCPCEVPTTCTILRSVEKIPPIINSLYGLLIDNVTLVDGTIINQTSDNKAKYKKYSKYTSKTPYYFIKNDYLYVINLDHLKYITITAVFEDLIDVYHLFKCGSQYDICNYSALDYNVPIDESLLNVLVMGAVQEISILQSNKQEQDERREETVNE